MWCLVSKYFILSAVKRSEYAITTATQTIENLLLDTVALKVELVVLIVEKDKRLDIYKL